MITRGGACVARRQPPGVIHAPLAAGAAIGEDALLNVLDFTERSTTPDLVFLNCCHIGRIDDYEASTARVRGRFADLASSVALALTNHGVKAVVAPGWAVDDWAAAAFATTFYEELTGGTPFGEAVRLARQEAHSADGGRSNTWGAYQCYGAPGFQLHGTHPAGSDQLQIVTANHLSTNLRAFAAQAGLARTDASANHIATELQDIEQQELARFATNLPEEHTWESAGALVEGRCGGHI